MTRDGTSMRYLSKGTSFYKHGKLGPLGLLELLGPHEATPKKTNGPKRIKKTMFFVSPARARGELCSFEAFTDAAQRERASLEPSGLQAASSRVTSRASHSLASPQDRDLETVDPIPERLRESACADPSRWGDFVGGAP